MLRRPVEVPPAHVYPADEWRIVESRYHERFHARAETVLAQIEFAAYTVVPAASFDALVEALDTPDRPNQLLVAAAQRLREFDLD